MLVILTIPSDKHYIPFLGVILNINSLAELDVP